MTAAEKNQNGKFQTALVHNIHWCMIYSKELYSNFPDMGNNHYSGYENLHKNSIAYVALPPDKKNFLCCL